MYTWLDCVLRIHTPVCYVSRPTRRSRQHVRRVLHMPPRRVLLLRRCVAGLRLDARGRGVDDITWPWSPLSRVVITARSLCDTIHAFLRRGCGITRGAANCIATVPSPPPPPHSPAYLASSRIGLPARSLLFCLPDIVYSHTQYTI